MQQIFYLKSIIQEINQTNKVDKVIYLPLDNKKLEAEIEKHITDKSKYILFIDEIQNVKGFEKVQTF